MTTILLDLDQSETEIVLHALRHVAGATNNQDVARLLYSVSERVADQMGPQPEPTADEAVAERQRMIDALAEHTPEYDLDDLSQIAVAHWRDVCEEMSDDELRAEYADRCGEDEDYGKPAPTVVVDIDANGNPHHCQHPVSHTEGVYVVCSVCRTQLALSPVNPFDGVVPGGYFKPQKE